MGPVERAVREAMSGGRSLDPDAAVHMATLGRYHFDRLVERGIAVLRDGRYVLVERPAPTRADESASLAAYRDRQAALTAAAQEQRRATEARARLVANLGDYRADERPIVLAEREQALRESRAILAPTDGG